MLLYKFQLGCKEDEDITGAVPIENIGGVFIVCTAGVVLAFLALPVEKAWFKYKERQDKNRVKSIAVTEANGDSKMDSDSKKMEKEKF